jgi:hypothetical protein
MLFSFFGSATFGLGALERVGRWRSLFIIVSLETSPTIVCDGFGAITVAGVAEVASEVDTLPSSPNMALLVQKAHCHAKPFDGFLDKGGLTQSR